MNRKVGHSSLGRRKVTSSNPNEREQVNRVGTETLHLTSLSGGVSRQRQMFNDTSCRQVVCREKNGYRTAVSYKGKRVPPHLQDTLDKCCHAAVGKRGSLVMQIDGLGNVLNIGEKTIGAGFAILIRDFKHPNFGQRPLVGPTVDLFPFGAQRIFGTEPVPAVAIIRGATGRPDYIYGRASAAKNQNGQVNFEVCRTKLRYILPPEKVATFRDHTAWPPIDCVWHDGPHLEFIDQPVEYSPVAGASKSKKRQSYTAQAYTAQEGVIDHCQSQIHQLTSGMQPNTWLFSLIQNERRPFQTTSGNFAPAPCGFVQCLTSGQQDLLAAAEIPEKRKAVQRQCTLNFLLPTLTAALEDPINETRWSTLYRAAEEHPAIGEQCAEAVSEYIWSVRAKKCRNSQTCTGKSSDPGCDDKNLIEFMSRMKENERRSSS